MISQAFTTTHDAEIKISQTLRGSVNILGKYMNTIEKKHWSFVTG